MNGRTVRQYMSPDPAIGDTLLKQIDIHVGRRLRHGRLMSGLSQTEVGKAMGTVFQQIQKYENGSNRIPASGLFRLAQILRVPVSFFYEGLPEDESASGDAKADTAYDPLKSDVELLPRRETIELIRSYFRIRDPRLRRGIYQLMRFMNGDRQ
jgi:transcriptional regulator with XRE-family HTH domain